MNFYITVNIQLVSVELTSKPQDLYAILSTFFFPTLS